MFSDEVEPTNDHSEQYICHGVIDAASLEVRKAKLAGATMSEPGRQSRPASSGIVASSHFYLARIVYEYEWSVAEPLELVA